MIEVFFDVLQECLCAFGGEYWGSKLLGAKMRVAKSGIQRQICLSCFSPNGGNCWTSYNEKEAARIITFLCETSFDLVAIVLE